jgi:tetratricopeptide (TPR) repeat protein
MSKPKVFISYSHVDEKRWKNRLQKHLKVLERHGSLRFWDDRRIAAGQEWRAEIKAALDSADAAILLISTDFLGSNFMNDEEVPVILQRRISDGMKVFPLIVRSCPWRKVPWLEPLQARPIDGKPLAQFRGDDVDQILSELVSEIEALLNQPQPKPTAETEIQTSMATPAAGECPYLGLEAFTEDKEHLFFGRDDFADALLAKVKRQNFVALVGPSGCGKSSVVQAGLFPRLRADSHKWETILFPPREDPFLSLAAGFVWRWQPHANYAINTNEAKKLAVELKDGQGLIEAIQHTVAAPDGRLLLVIDQFEEMFTLCEESARRAFLDVMLAAKDATPVTILLTLRADFMGQAQSISPAFSQLLDNGIVSHRPLTRADLETVITGPARYAGLEFEPGLVNIILQEVAAQPDSLPLLEYALKEMWRRRQSQTMGLALYEAVGKVEGAISQHADAVLRVLPEDEQALALRALTRLVRVAGEENEADTRLRLPLSELLEVERAVLQTFVTARLLVTNREEGAGVETIEVSHEALIRRWENLREALDSDREFLMWRRRLDSRRKAWEQKRRDEKWLLYGGEHDDAQRWLNERGAELTDAEVEFITWDNRPEFQIERILPKSLSLLLSSDINIRNNWFATLVFCREKEEALSIARDIEVAPYLAEAHHSIAEALVKAGMVTEAREAATEALAAVRKIESAYARGEALDSMAGSLGRARMTTEALAAAREIESAVFRSIALISMAEALMSEGMVMEAREVATEALAAAREAEFAEPEAQALSLIADAFGKAGMATEALAAVREIDVNDRAKALRSIVDPLVKAGMVTEALASAREIKGLYSRAPVLSSIVKALVKAGMVTEALAAAREIEDVYPRASALISIAKPLVKAGMVIEACELMTEALVYVRKIEQANLCADAILTVANFWIEQGQAENAENLLGEVRSAISKIFLDVPRSRALRRLAVILARLHSYRVARETADQCFSSSDRLAAYTAILREYHIERDPNLAQLFAEEKEEEEDD